MKIDALGRFVRIPLKDRFWTKVNKDGPIHPYDSSRGKCWLWTGGRTKRNYGRVSDGKRQLLAHRVAWELTHGRKIPKAGLLHSCDNPPCVNPNHTYPGTPTDNHRDMVDHGRSTKGEKHAMAKITDDLAREIKKNFPLRRKKGPSTVEERAARAAFFKKYKVRYATARNIALGESWKHITR